MATAPFAHVPIKLGRVPIFVERLMTMSHDIGVQVVAWRIDEPVMMRHLLDAGVDGIITDRPDLLREVLVSRSQWAPMASRHDAPADRLRCPRHITKYSPVCP